MLLCSAFRWLACWHKLLTSGEFLASQVTGIFGSSMEVYICVDGESPGSGPSAGGPQENGSNHGVEAAPGVFHCGSAFATVSFAVCCCPCHQRVQPAAAWVLHQQCLDAKFGNADAQVVSAAGPWPPVAVPVPFRLEPSTEEERLRCKVQALNSICCATLIAFAKCCCTLRCSRPIEQRSIQHSRLDGVYLLSRERRAQRSGVRIGC